MANVGYAGSADKIEESLKNLLGNIEGCEGENNILFKDALGESVINDYAKQLYKESQKRKTKATIATHKYLMNKLNKL